MQCGACLSSILRLQSPIFGYFSMVTMNEVGLFALCAMTSALTSVIGVGGGMTLLATLPNVLAPNLVIPIHGATQLISNLSRLALDWRLVAWRLIWPFLPGAAIGAVLGSLVLGGFSFEYLPLLLGVFILLVTWTKLVQRSGVLFNNMTVLGVFLTSTSLFIGSMGLILPSVLLNQGLKKDEVILTQSAMMSVMHASKVVAYIAAGFAFWRYGGLMAMMLSGSVLGSYLGKHLRGRVNEARGVWLLKWTVTLLALQLIGRWLWENAHR